MMESEKTRAVAYVKGGKDASLPVIDVMRGVAALMVAALHTREITWIGIRSFYHVYKSVSLPEAIVGFASFPLVWGSIGVPIFFVISGYCIHRAQAVVRGQKGGYELDVTNFYVRRFFRIYPVLIAALLLTLFSDLVSAYYVPNNGKLGDHGVVNFLINALSVQGIVGTTYGSNGPLWTLSIEVQFYAMYPILLILLTRGGKYVTGFVIVLINILSYLVLERNGYVVFFSYYVSWCLGVVVAELCSNARVGELVESGGIKALLYSISLLLTLSGCLAFFYLPYRRFSILGGWIFHIYGRYSFPCGQQRGKVETCSYT